MNKLLGYFYISLPLIFWGISFVSTEIIIAHLGAMTIAAVRLIFCVILMYISFLIKGQMPTVKRQDYGLYFLVGVVGIAIYFYFENLGIKILSAVLSSLIIATIPALTMIFDLLIFGRKLTKIDIFSLIFSIIGVGVVLEAWKLTEVFSGGKLLGYFFMIGAAISWVVYTLASKPLLTRYDYSNFIFWQFSFAIPVLVIGSFFEENNWGAMNTELALHLIFLAVGASYLGFFGYARAMKILGASESSLFINLLPVVTVIFSYFYRHTYIGANIIIGGTIIILSAVLPTLRNDVQIAEKAKE